jgi:hypothetical protein
VHAGQVLVEQHPVQLLGVQRANRRTAIFLPLKIILM